ncbi:MAG TPA: TrpB-like pyridoxal phosphate-dependent enzyme [Methanotrichaceae archaeon]|nr:TrpB-like pyridoxal phosphate-dependent enzyme [Methanotrichaceae archaeon]HQF17401.1 TrpB-like pyridoxal phosphate-dependent enzyme [Methanotrichaceae archaeon]HQI91163.1 TrpB-like pyridoxal phosphate-dependent enzyme [Methanotrichaceae archaeon]HQJ29232.1 TrpB-like pyridoxal phosphate-dependent enzyme [Methanotrichaceae archaeon]
MIYLITKFLLDEEEIPKRWYNVAADLPTPLDPPLHPATGEPLKPADLEPIFSKELIKQEASTERWIDIPEEVREIYRLWRPTPLYRAVRLERALKTPARIYYKYEGVSPAGSHKPNTAIPQAYYNMKEGIARIATETGAGQWGSALSLATCIFNMKCTVYMVRASYDQKPYRRSMMRVWGAECIPSPSDRTNSGRQIRERLPNTPGSLGIAISEAVEDAATHDDTNYALGSVLNHVLLHQTVEGLEVKKQFEMADDYPDVIYGCCGGGSNFPGVVFPFVPDKLGDKKDLRMVACEPTACPTLTKGMYTYDFGDTARLTPLLKMYTLGHDFIPPGIHAGGLRYHGDAPLLCNLVNNGVIEAAAFHQTEVFDAAVTFARAEGIIPAPESSHAIKPAIDEAIACRKSGQSKALLINLSGHGHFDLSSYDAYFEGRLEDYEYPEELVKQSLAKLPKR